MNSYFNKRFNLEKLKLAKSGRPKYPDEKLCIMRSKASATELTFWIHIRNITLRQVWMQAKLWWRTLCYIRLKLRAIPWITDQDLVARSAQQRGLTAGSKSRTSRASRTRVSASRKSSLSSRIMASTTGAKRDRNWQNPFSFRTLTSQCRSQYSWGAYQLLLNEIEKMR